MPKASKFARAKRITVRDKQVNSSTSSAKSISELADKNIPRTLKFLEDHPAFVTNKFRFRAQRAAVELLLKKKGIHVKRENGHVLILNKDISTEEHLRKLHATNVAKLRSLGVIKNTSKK